MTQTNRLALVSREIPNVPAKLSDEVSLVLQLEMEEISESFLPSKHSLFLTIENMSTAQLSRACRWNLLTLQYEVAMRAIRQGEILVPYLSEEGLEDLREWSGHSEKLFQWVGEKLSSAQVSALLSEPRPQTQRFMRMSRKLYASGLGAWCFISMVQKDWLGAFERALGPHFMGHASRGDLHLMTKSCLPKYTSHMSLNAISYVVSRRPRILEETLKQAREMAAGLDDLWNDFQSLLLEPPSSGRK